MDLKFDLRRAAREYVRRFYQIVYQKELPPFDPTSRFANNVAVFRELARNMPMEVMKSRVGNIVHWHTTYGKNHGLTREQSGPRRLLV